MKRSSTPYWVVTGLLTAIMLLASVPDVLRVPLAVGVFMHLGYPTYLLPFIGVAKLLGVLALVVPDLPRLKEWAYAGLTFDLIGALYSHLSVGDPPGAWFPAAVALLLVLGSYVLHRRLPVASRDASPW
jgi:DoxX-like protein